MKTLLLAGVAVLLLVGAVLLLRRRPPLRKQIPPGPPQIRAVEDSAQVVQPRPMDARLGPRQRRQMLRYLRAAYEKGSKARLAAMEEMVAWGHPACLPLLRRGLRDADLRVVGLAARGLERFRGPRQRQHQRPTRRWLTRHRPAKPV